MQRDTDSMAWHSTGYGVLHLLVSGIAIGVAWLSIHIFSAAANVVLCTRVRLALPSYRVMHQHKDSLLDRL